MKIKYNIKIGYDSFTVESDATDLKDQFLELYNMRPRWKCDHCGNTDRDSFRLFCNKTDDGFKYVKIICYGQEGECKASSTLGTFKDNKGYFWKKFEKFEGKTTSPKRLEKGSIEDYSL